MDKEEYKTPPDIEHLKELAIFLEGLWFGKGNILPLGRIHLESLWDIYKQLKEEQIEIGEST